MTRAGAVTAGLMIVLAGCGDSARAPAPAPRAVGTLIVDPPLDPATEAEVVRSRAVAERAARAQGVDQPTRDRLQRAVQTRVRPDSRIVEVTVVVTSAGPTRTPADLQAAVAACDLWMRAYLDRVVDAHQTEGLTEERRLVELLEALPPDADRELRARTVDRLAQVRLARAAMRVPARVLDPCVLAPP